jgi:GntR family histidine utilization transcriptional repressor
MTEVQALGLAYRFEIVGRGKRRAGRADLDRLHLEAKVPVLDLNCLHFAGKEPFCHEERLINLDAVPEADAETFAERAPGPWLVERVPWSTAEHRIQAVGANSVTAAALGIAEGTACLLIERRTWGAEKPITHVRLTYPGNGHELVAHFAPSRS